jgi:hypothetical protein
MPNTSQHSANSFLAWNDSVDTPKPSVRSIGLKLHRGLQYSRMKRGLPHERHATGSTRNISQNLQARSKTSHSPVQCCEGTCSLSEENQVTLANVGTMQPAIPAETCTFDTETRFPSPCSLCSVRASPKQMSVRGTRSHFSSILPKPRQGFS